MPAAAGFTSLVVSLHNHKDNIDKLKTLYAHAFCNLCVIYKFLRLDQISGTVKREKKIIQVPECLLSLTVFILC